MRLRPDKIHALAEHLAQTIQDHPKVDALASSDALRVAIGSVITDNLAEEDDINAEVDALIAEHSRQINSEDLDVEALRVKFKREIAKKRGFRL